MLIAERSQVRVLPVAPNNTTTGTIMKESEFTELFILGKMQAAHKAMDISLPQDKELRAKWIEAKSLAFKVLDAHWDACNKFVTDELVTDNFVTDDDT